jgi:hypothetical protein
MADIVEITFSIKKNDYPCQTFVSHSVSAQVDSVSAFTCDVTERYTDHAMKLCHSIARTMERDKALHKSIGSEPCSNALRTSTVLFHVKQCSAPSVLKKLQKSGG